MRRLDYLLLSSGVLIAPVSATAAFAQLTTSQPSATASGSALSGASPKDIVPPTKNSGVRTGMVRKISPDSPSAQLANPTGAQPGTGSGMGKVSGTSAGN